MSGCQAALLLSLLTAYAVQGRHIYRTRQTEARSGDNGLKQLLKDLKISDKSITASSTFSAKHAAQRVRTDQYFDYACSWSAAKRDSKPWVQFDMGVSVTVSAILIKPRCDPPYQEQRVLSFNLKASDDGLTWRDALVNTTTDYANGTDRSVSYLAKPMTARYWRIALLTWNKHPSLRADLMGRVASCYEV